MAIQSFLTIERTVTETHTTALATTGECRVHRGIPGARWTGSGQPDACAPCMHLRRSTGSIGPGRGRPTPACCSSTDIARAESYECVSTAREGRKRDGCRTRMGFMQAPPDGGLECTPPYAPLEIFSFLLRRAGRRAAGAMCFPRHPASASCHCCQRRCTSLERATATRRALCATHCMGRPRVRHAHVSADLVALGHGLTISAPTLKPVSTQDSDCEGSPAEVLRIRTGTSHAKKHVS